MTTKNWLDLSRPFMTSPITSWGSRFVEKSGFSVTRAENTFRAKRLEAIRRLRIETVLDIGANVGQWAHDLRDCGYNQRIISFEPAPGPFAQLQAFAGSGKNHDCVQAGLGDQDGEAQLLVLPETVNSSFRAKLQSRSLVLAVEESVTVPIRRLDSLLPSMTAISDRFYMKLDTQGFEREVLTGAVEILARTDAVEVELSFIELYRGQALLPEIWQMLTRAGFRPAWLERGYRDAEDIWLLQADGLFIREEIWNARQQSQPLARRRFGRLSEASCGGIHQG